MINRYRCWIRSAKSAELLTPVKSWDIDYLLSMPVVAGPYLFPCDRREAGGGLLGCGMRISRGFFHTGNTSPRPGYGSRHKPSQTRRRFVCRPHTPPLSHALVLGLFKSLSNFQTLNPDYIIHPLEHICEAIRGYKTQSHNMCGMQYQLIDRVMTYMMLNWV